MNKQKVIVIYGGRSVEHEISCKSAYFIVTNIDSQKYDIILISIDKSAIWQLQNLTDCIDYEQKILKINANAIVINPWDFLQSNKDAVVFPILHGSFGEDGTLQGFLELIQIAYVGANTCGSCIGIDKVIAKQLAQQNGINVVPFCFYRCEVWLKNKQDILKQITQSLKFPLFVKPARCGSSIGMTKVYNIDKLSTAIDKAFSYDTKILVEKALRVREIECAVIGTTDTPVITQPGEIKIINAEFYDYEAKYIKTNAAQIIVPAELNQSLSSKAQDISIQVFKALDLYGMARVDLFLEQDTNIFYFNEVNTIPGFTEISQFPKLLINEGYTPEKIINMLIQLANIIHRQKLSLNRVYSL